MPSFRSGPVVEILSERRGLQRVTVRLADVDPQRAYVLTDLTGSVAVGDRVVVNTTAVELGLGTGGWHVVHWNLARDDWSQPGPGHIMKLRYTSLQADTGAAEELHPHVASDLDGMPVVACSLHSQVAVVAAAIAHTRPGTRVAYVMTDGAALPLALSDLIAMLIERGLVAGTVTAGHAFGGDLEAVTVPSALTLARTVLDAEIAVVAMGPGVVGTGTRLGTTAIEVAPVLDAVVALGGTPIICPRWSSTDTRSRHRGLSHHTVTALSLLRSPVQIPVPADHQPAITTETGSHELIDVETPDMATLLASMDLTVTTMGRGPADEPEFFAFAGAAGVLATRQLMGTTDR